MLDLRPMRRPALAGREQEYDEKATEVRAEEPGSPAAVVVSEGQASGST
jgi:hypothetical protein